MTDVENVHEAKTRLSRLLERAEADEETAREFEESIARPIDP